MICLYKVASTNSDEVSTRSFNFVSMAVFMDLDSNISNLFSISNAYFPWLRKIFSGLCQTSRLNALGLSSNSVASFFCNM
jgi:hypothetical protein